MPASFRYISQSIYIAAEKAATPASFSFFAQSTIKPTLLELDLSTNVDEQFLSLEKVVFSHPNESQELEILISGLENNPIERVFGYDPNEYSAVVIGLYKGIPFSKPIELTIIEI